MITKVTVTGADDSVDPSELLDLQARFPFAEFGILVSEKYSLASGAVRFPSKRWLQLLIGACGGKMNLSCHICGRWVDDLLGGTFPDFTKISDWFRYSFQRFQVNTHGVPRRIAFEALNEIVDALRVESKNVIFQIDSVNNIIPMIERLQTVEALFDLSHGAGVLPPAWPTPIDRVSCGYAGGLSPENVEEQIQKIISVSNGKEFWIDAETKLRDGGNFDLDKVAAFLEKAKPWVK